MLIKVFDMKKVILLTALALGAMLSATAQNSLYQSTFGAVMGASGAYEIVDPSTVIAVDITVEKEQNIVGPYARYAQKYLDTRGSLVEKVTYNITDIKLSLVADAQLFAPTELPAESVEILSHNGSATEFAKILPDRLDNTSQSLDAAAMDAAQQIFDIRKHRMELITGEAGENVFGAGLKDALEALDKQETALLELFFGKNIITTTSERYYIPIDASQKQYIVTHFSKNAGIGDSGEAITLNIAPSGKNGLKNITEADPKDKSVMKVRVADLCTCTIKIGDEPYPTQVSVIPIFEFGRTINVSKR